MENSALISIQKEWLERLAQTNSNHFSLKMRVQLYTEIQKAAGLNFLNWLGYNTAELVLPIFSKALPRIKTPSHTNKLVKKVLTCELEVTSRRVQAYRELTYYETGQQWGVEEGSIISNVYFAGCTTRAALLQICGTYISDTNFKSELISSIFEQDIAIADQDPCAGAILALASVPNQKIDINIARSFWIWWLTENWSLSSILLEKYKCN